jgi:hypothetical protein
MATRNPANEIEFNVVNFGAPVSVFAIEAATGAAAEVSPGEDMEAFVEAVQQRGTVLGLGALTDDTTNSFFNVYVENSSWTAGTLETAVQAVGGIFAAATVTDAGL